MTKTCECKFTMADDRKPLVNFATNSFIGATTNEKHDKVLTNIAIEITGVININLPFVSDLNFM